MSTVIAVTGKGGTGKTTVSALLIRYLVNAGHKPVLAVDADPDSNMPSALGLDDSKNLSTIGGTRQDFFDSKGEVPPGMPKEAFLELKLNQALVESKNLDMLVMGRPEGAGCYCYINNVLRKFLETLGNNYPFVVIDNEAGLEHLSRRTAQKVDYLLIVSDYSMNGLRAAVRIKELSQEMGLNVGKNYLVINNAPDDLSPQFNEAMVDTGVPLLGILPADENVPRYDIGLKALTDLPDSSPVVASLDQMAWALIHENK